MISSALNHQTERKQAFLSGAALKRDRAAPIASGICSYSFGPIGHALRTTLGASQRESHPPGISRAAPIAFRCGWAGRILPTLSLQYSSAKSCFPGGWTRCAPYLAVIDAGFPAQVVLAHPPASLAAVIPLHVSERIQIALFGFQGPRESIQKPSSLCRQRGGPFYASISKIF